ncbi:hypothetical protein MUP77_23045 [Candidatus Bathyarchaeota archaeon]|nr:hypothetical protein [Candidatus Bathyarchaeota archaeon]
MKFEETGSFYKKNKLKQVFLLIKKKLLAVNLFVQCLFDYNISIKGNELDVISCWELCDSFSDVKVGRTLKIIWD